MINRTAPTVVVLLTVAFALQLLTILSVPVTQAITLCTYDGYKFGVFGYCNNNGTCSPVQIGYSNVTVEELSVFSLPSNTRHSISRLLVVHPISAGFTLILLICCILVNFSRFSRSLNFLFFLLLWTLPTFLLTLLSFLVDILLFAPHLDWCGWLILASTVLVAVSGAMLCLMRRSTSSRLALYENNKMLNNQNNNKFSLMGFTYDGGSNSRENLLSDQVSQQSSVSFVSPNAYLGVHNNTNQDIRTMTETITNDSRIFAPENNSPDRFTQYDNSQKVKSGYPSMIPVDDERLLSNISPPVPQQPITPYPVAHTTDYNGNKLALPSEIRASAAYPVIKLQGPVQNSRLSGYTSVFDPKQMDDPRGIKKTNSKRSKSGVSLNYGTTSSDDDSDVNTSVYMSEIISSGEAMEIQVPERISRYNDVKNDGQNAATMSPVQPLNLKTVQINPQTEKANFLESISQYMKSPEQDMNITKMMSGNQNPKRTTQTSIPYRSSKRLPNRNTININGHTVPFPTATDIPSAGADFKVTVHDYSSSGKDESTTSGSHSSVYA